MKSAATSVFGIIQVKVVPGASRNRIAGRYENGIKVQVAAAAERGKANLAVAALLADAMNIRQADVTLISAPSNPRKQFRIDTIAQQVLDEWVRSQ